MEKPKRYRRMPTKQLRKRFDGCCYFCREGRYELLDSHRILPGAKGGKYHWQNCLTLCSRCHRIVEAGIIEVLSRHPTSTADWALRVRVAGEEHFVWPPSRRDVDPAWLSAIICGPVGCESAPVREQGGS